MVIPFERDVRSFFFRNIPDHCNLDTLHAKNNELGKVIDVFCPRKWDKEGNRFDFVRYPGGQGFDTEGILSKLNNIWIGSYKIRAYLLIFERIQPKQRSPLNYPFEADKGLRTPGELIGMS